MNGPAWTGVVLAGGRSERMGEDKALMQFEGRTLVDRAMDLLDPLVSELLVIGDPAKYGHLGPFVIGDDRPGMGPLGGLATALRYASNEHMLVMACDLPMVNAALFHRLMQALGSSTDAVVPKHGGLIEPLAAAYHRRCLPVFRRCVDDGVLKMSDALSLVRTTFIEVVPGDDRWPLDLFRNLNSPSDL